MRKIVTNTFLSLLARVFFNQKNFGFLEVGPYDYQLTEQDLTFETATETVERETYTMGELAFG